MQKENFGVGGGPVRCGGRGSSTKNKNAKKSGVRVGEGVRVDVNQILK